jgi:hypothetical protein
VEVNADATVWGSVCLAIAPTTLERDFSAVAEDLEALPNLGVDVIVIWERLPQRLRDRVDFRERKCGRQRSNQK